MHTKTREPLIPISTTTLLNLMAVWIPIYLVLIQSQLAGVAILASLAKLTMIIANRYQRFALLVVLGSVLGIGVSTLPAQAQFFFSAETWAIGAFQQAPVTTIVFNLLRFFLLVIVAVGLITSINAARQGDDWMATARIPLLIVVVVTVADLITSQIVGTGGAGAAGAGAAGAGAAIAN